MLCITHGSEGTDTTHCLVLFTHAKKCVKTANGEISAKLQSVVSDNHTTIRMVIPKAITAFNDNRSEWNTTGPVTSVDKSTETTSLEISHKKLSSSSAILACRVINTAKPHLLWGNPALSNQ